MLRRLASGIILSTAIILVTFVAQILAVPIYLMSWGPRVYGEWIILTSLVTSIPLLNLGIQSHVNNLLIACYVRRRIEEGSQVLASALRLYSVLSVVALSGVLALCLFPTLIQALGVKAIPVTQIRLIVGLQGLLATYAMIGGLLASVFRAALQQPRQLAYGLVQTVLMLGTPCGVATLGGSPQDACIATTLTVAVLAVVQLRDILRRSPFRITLAGSTWKHALSLVGPSSLFFAVTVSAQLLVTGVILIISRSAGALAVTLFSTTLMLTNFIRTLTHQGLNVLQPEITAAAIADEHERLIRWHRLIWKLGFVLAVISATGISLLGGDVLSLWTRAKVSPDFTLNLLLCIYLVIQAPALISSIFGLATNHQVGVFKVQFPTVVASLIAAVLLVPRFGASGAAAALLLGQIGGTLFMTKAACTWTGDTTAAILRLNLLRAVPVVSLAMSLVAGCAFRAPDSLTRLAALALGIPFLLIAGWFTCLTEYERSVVLHHLRLNRLRAVAFAQ